MRIPESEVIINGDGTAFHLHVKPEHLADKVILVGDPGRVELFAPHMEEIENRSASREFVSLTGRYRGTRFTALSTGIGTDNIDIVLTELDALANVDFVTREVNPVHRTLDILRIGTCGAIQPDVPPTFPSAATACSTGMRTVTASPCWISRRLSRSMSTGIRSSRPLISSGPARN